MADEYLTAALYGMKRFNEWASKKVKELMWMEKLIELLNEYETTLEPNEQIEWTENWVKSTPLVIISKKYWFIKWLVENEKIEWNNKDIAIKEWILWKSIDNYHSLLMALAIQDEPINFLISILK